MLGLIQIPNISEAVDSKGVYTVFNIHINGCYHGSFRYSQLLTFHQELKSAFPGKHTSLEDFPGKHWFSSLSPEQLLARRIGLERYFHSVCQDRDIGTSNVLKEFLIAIQKASTNIPEPSADVEVFLVNGKSVKVRVGTYDRTDQVLEKVCSEINLSSEFTYFFGLFFEKEEDDSTWTVDRPLTDFECPFPSLQTINKTATHRITIRKSFWDPVFLPELCSDRVARNLLYIEALAAVSDGHWEIMDDVRKELNALQKKALKKEYLELVGTLHQYGFAQLDGLTIDHPDDNTKASIRVGKIEMVSYTAKDEAAPPTKTFTYSLTKIKSWKLGGKPGHPWLKFFFQLGAGDFVPVGVVGGQSVLLSYSLHSIVDELLRVRAKQDIRQPATQPIVRELRELPSLTFYESADPAIPVDPVVDTVDDVSTEETTPTDTPSDTAPQETPPLSGSGSIKPQPSNTTTKTTQARQTSVSSIGEPDASAKVKASKEPKIKTPKKKMPSISDVENPTFEFGTDDDL